MKYKGTTERIIIDEGVINYFDSHETNKPVILLLHGFFADHRQYLHHIPYLLRFFRVIAADIPGFGFSQGLIDNSIEGVTDHISKFLVELKKKHINIDVIWGTSLGGIISLRLAHKFPGIKLIIAESAPMNYRYIEIGLFRFGKLIQPILENDSVLKIIGWLRNISFIRYWIVYGYRLLGGNIQNALYRFPDELMDDFALRMDLHAAMQIFDSLTKFKSDDLIVQIKQPVLLINSEKEVTSHIDGAKTISMISRNFELYTFKGTYHVPSIVYTFEAVEVVLEKCKKTGIINKDEIWDSQKSKFKTRKPKRQNKLNI